MNALIRSLWPLSLSLALSACAGVGIANNDLRWMEEVKLSDGRIIQIERKTEITSHSGFPANSRGLYKAHEICYAPMNISWKSKGAYRPDIFDIVDGKAYVHVSLSAAAECMEQGNPIPNALYFVWENEAWRRITHEEFPTRSEWNLLYDSQGAIAEDDVSDLATLPNKLERRDKSLRYEQKRLGWKRVSESLYFRDGCLKWGSTNPNANPSGTEIFTNDRKTSCQ